MSRLIRNVSNQIVIAQSDLRLCEMSQIIIQFQFGFYRDHVYMTHNLLYFCFRKPKKDKNLTRY